MRWSAGSHPPVLETISYVLKDASVVLNLPVHVVLFRDGRRMGGHCVVDQGRLAAAMVSGLLRVAGYFKRSISSNCKLLYSMCAEGFL